MTRTACPLCLYNINPLDFGVDDINIDTDKKGYTSDNILEFKHFSEYSSAIGFRSTNPLEVTFILP